MFPSSSKFRSIINFEPEPSVPALVVGTGLIISGALGRRNRRKKLLSQIHDPKM